MRQQLWEAIVLYAESGHGNVRPVHSRRYKKLWRLKVGSDWRALFHTREPNSVEFIGIGDRKSIYRDV